MSPKDAFHKTVHSATGGCQVVALRMGYSYTVMKNKANPNIDCNHATLDDVDNLMGLTADYTVLHALAAKHGFVCTHIDAAGASDMSVLESVTDVWSKMGNLGAEVHQALADGRVDSLEVKSIEAAAFVAMRPIMQLLERIRSMSEK